VIKLAKTDHVTIGSSITFAIGYGNLGNADATNVVLTDVVGGGCLSPSGFTNTSIGSLAPNAFIVIDVTFTATTPGACTNTITISASNAPSKSSSATVIVDPALMLPRVQIQPIAPNAAAPTRVIELGETPTPTATTPMPTIGPSPGPEPVDTPQPTGTPKPTRVPAPPATSEPTTSASSTPSNPPAPTQGADDSATSMPPTASTVAAEPPRAAALVAIEIANTCASAANAPATRPAAITTSISEKPHSLSNDSVFVFMPKRRCNARSSPRAGA